MRGDTSFECYSQLCMLVLSTILNLTHLALLLGPVRTKVCHIGGKMKRNLSVLTIKEDCAVDDALPHHYEIVKNPAEYEELKQANYAKIKFLEQCDQDTPTLNTNI